MASNNAFRIMGYIYVGLCLISSLLLIINSSYTLKATGYEWVMDPPDRFRMKAIGYEGAMNPPQSFQIISTNTSVTSVTTLIFAIISMIFNLCLLLGLRKRNITLVKCHLYYITTVFILMVLGLFIGCIVVGVLVGGNPSYSTVEENSATVIGVTLLFIFYTTVITLIFTLAVWILNGVIGNIRIEEVRHGMNGQDLIAGV
ncbi:uncharacterized protein LOC129770663 [Toxorhynchites rutilus septentrionalis]|uniref:uncharacterized protein LOC129770663 n=1 Tax=Toxorhynchites rutilus septentrionalis TaxID=329112 RepID=UPI002478EFD6|nr:uncharacterized protein LOC129770663 [Toxorhynchites rutilus septentrionalis]